MRRLLVGVLVLGTACSLPLPKDVKTVGEVQPGVQQPGGLKVFPPLPQKTDTPVKVVEGFLRAQANSDNSHAIARAFLTDEESASWDDQAEVQVYTAESRQTDQVVTGPTATVVVRSQVIGDVAPDGRYVGARRQVVERYTLLDTSSGWRLTNVPNGLRLTAADLFRAYQPRDVYYLAPKRSAGDQPHLVPDRVYLPADGDLATVLVRRALRPPSSALNGTVTTGVPQDVTLAARSVRHEADGVVAVDLSGPVTGFSPAQREALAARLVWTLRGDPSFRGLRLLDEGKRVSVPGVGNVEDSGAFDAYDPEGLGLDPPYFFVSGRRLRASLPSLPLATSKLTTQDVRSGGIAVDGVAVTTNRTQLAVLDSDAVRVGALASGDYPVVARGAGLSSLSWGSGAFGLWLVQRGVGVVRVDPARPGLQRVNLVGELPGTPSALSMSRDGSRAAVVAAGRLFVLRVEAVNGVPRLVDPTELAPGDLVGVRDVAWATPTELVVIRRLTSGPASVLRLPVDGSTSTVVQASGLTPVALAAAGSALLVQSGTSLYALGSTAALRQASGTLPNYPG